MDAAEIPRFPHRFTSHAACAHSQWQAAVIGLTVWVIGSRGHHLTSTVARATIGLPPRGDRDRTAARSLENMRRVATCLAQSSVAGVNGRGIRAT
jgi:hypothetical protein